jgi:hypothetical protein
VDASERLPQPFQLLLLLLLEHAPVVGAGEPPWWDGGWGSPGKPACGSMSATAGEERPISVKSAEPSPAKPVGGVVAGDGPSTMAWYSAPPAKAASRGVSVCAVVPPAGLYGVVGTGVL